MPADLSAARTVSFATLGCRLNQVDTQQIQTLLEARGFRTVDFNFDGYQDIYVLTSWGATGNNQGCIWLYDPAAKHLDYSPEFSDLGTFTLDPMHKTIITWGNGGMAGGVHSAAKYKVESNRPVLIYDERQDWDQEKKQFHCTVKELRGHEMVTTQDEWGRTSGNSGPGPCEHQTRIF